ncbi:MAG TPA: heterodisulfide reductase-related iron-sulfur binding cluster, partial [Tepidisphaeraceae bacterium]|nr:heterodisulfide reductase-related iron-sulfur binding cluster [Tepidisphaeraceae bacterium]
LDCRGCETACPSSVVYHELIEETRAKLAERTKPTAQGRFMQWIFFHIFIHPTRLKLALLPARLMQRIGLYGLLRKIGVFKILPLQLRKMEQMLPDEGSIWPKKLPVHSRAGGMDTVLKILNPNTAGDVRKPKAVVGFFAGCIGSVMFDKVNRQAVELLAACGADVYAAPNQNCCGAIHHHNGAHHPAEELAKRNIDAFLPKDGEPVDYIVSNIAGCGAMLKEYDFLLRDDKEYAERAKEFSKRVRDVSEVLVLLGLPAMNHPVEETITYHDACHLAHAQKVTEAPRKLLAAVPGLKMIPLPESDMCCGAAGTYNLTQPVMATQLAERKLNNISATHATTCATGNVGCAMHIQSQANARHQTLKVVHPVEILHRAVFGSK